MSHCDELIVTTTLEGGGSDFREGDEILVIATYQPDDDGEIRDLQEKVLDFCSDRQADLRRWFNQNFHHHVVIRRGEHVVAHDLPLAKVRITKRNNLALTWKWDSAGSPPGSYSATVKVEKKERREAAESEHLSQTAEAAAAPEEFVAVKKAKTIQENG